jgi:hypothetical protein
MVDIRTYEDAVSKHEARFTPHFAKRGFVWEAYVDTRDLNDVMFYPLFNVPVELIENRRCPIFKRKSFFATPDMYLGENGNDVARGLYEYLLASGRYDAELLVPHLLRTSTQHELRSALNLFRVMAPAAPETEWPAIQAALVVDGRADRALPDRLARARAVSEHVTVFVSGGEHPGFRSLADAASAADGAYAVAGDFDVVGVLSALGEESYPGTVAMATAAHGYDAVAADPGTVQSILGWFESDPFLGIAMPSPTVHSSTLGAIGRASEAADMQGTELQNLVGVDFRDPDVGDACASSFWFRSSALARVVRSEESLAAGLVDVTGDQQMQVLPLLAQAEGFYTSHVLSMHQSDATLTNLYHVVRTVNRIAGHLGDDVGSLGAHLHGENPRAGLQPPASSPMTMYWDLGDGFSEVNAVRAAAVRKGNLLEVEWTVPEGAVGARLDPIEGYGCAVTGLRVVAPAGVTVHPSNGVRSGTVDVFDDDDPRYNVDGQLTAGARLRFSFERLQPFPSGWGLGPVLLDVRPRSVRRSARG